jgi:hypothetical protein
MVLFSTSRPIHNSRDYNSPLHKYTRIFVRVGNRVHVQTETAAKSFEKCGTVQIPETALINQYCMSKEIRQQIQFEECLLLSNAVFFVFPLAV